jgi:predicted Fe-Mo cluster-binding NifX family protein
LPAFSSLVIVAIPIWQERVSPVLDAATRLLVVTRRRGVDTQRREVLLGPLEPEPLARSIAELRVDLVLCAALSEALHRALRKHGVRVRSHLCGEADAVLRAFCCRRLAQDEFRMPGCWGQHFHGKCCRGHRAVRSADSKEQSKAA